MFYLIAFLLSVVVVAFVAAPLFRERRAWVGMPLHTRRARLLEERDTLLRELKDLDFDRHMGKIDDADYADLRAVTSQKATAVLDELDKLAANGKGRAAGSGAQAKTAARRDANANGSVQAGQALRLSEQIESEILVARARLRLQTDGAERWNCTCGRSMSNSDKFCASCGASRPQV